MESRDGIVQSSPDSHAQMPRGLPGFQGADRTLVSQSSLICSLYVLFLLPEVPTEYTTLHLQDARDYHLLWELFPSFSPTQIFILIHAITQ